MFQAKATDRKAVFVWLPLSFLQCCIVMLQHTGGLSTFCLVVAAQQTHLQMICNFEAEGDMS
jgi:hypothetical protein